MRQRVTSQLGTTVYFHKAVENCKYSNL